MQLHLKFIFQVKKIWWNSRNIHVKFRWNSHEDILSVQWTKSVLLQSCDTADRPVWFVFAGMGTQWYGMGRQMMKIALFKKSILRSDAVLRPYGVTLYNMLTTGGEDVFDDTLNSFVGIAAIQVHV